MRRLQLPVALAVAAGVASLGVSCGRSSSNSGRAHDGEAVSFAASDGVRLEGRAFGTGAVAVALAHMGRGGDSQADWYPLARELAGRGYLALTFNRRGVCPGGRVGCSEGADDLAASWSGYVFSKRRIAGIRGAKLFVSSRGDIYGGAAAAREWYSWAREPKRLELLPGSEHGTDLLASGGTRRRLLSLIVDFVTRAVPAA